MGQREIADELRGALASLPVRDTPSARAIRRQFSQRLRGAEPESVLSIAQELVDRGDDIERFVAYELIARHRSASALMTAARLRKLARRLDSWGAVDCFACYLAGPAWRERRISTDVVRRWARSRDRWWRRAALVSTVPLNNRARGGTGDVPRTLAICNMLVRDRDDMVVKAMSWALRELAKHDPAAVRNFVAQRSALLAPRVRREVDAKLRTGRKSAKRMVAVALSAHRET
jgi:3-methyladenine DNA glycosylase AlkD